MVTGVATRVHGGRTTATYEIAISDDRGRRVCSARLTCLLRDQVPPGGHDPGHVTAGREQMTRPVPVQAGKPHVTGRLSQTGQGMAAPLRGAGTPRYRGGESPGS